MAGLLDAADSGRLPTPICAQHRLRERRSPSKRSKGPSPTPTVRDSRGSLRRASYRRVKSTGVETSVTIVDARWVSRGPSRRCAPLHLLVTMPRHILDKIYCQEHGEIGRAHV